MGGACAKDQQDVSETPVSGWKATEKGKKYSALLKGLLLICCFGCLIFFDLCFGYSDIFSLCQQNLYLEASPLAAQLHEFRSQLLNSSRASKESAKRAWTRFSDVRNCDGR